MSERSDEALVEFLKLRGHSEEEIEKIVARLAMHDESMLRQSVFDSIEAGTFNLDELIKSALVEDPEDKD